MPEDAVVSSDSILIKGRYRRGESKERHREFPNCLPDIRALPGGGDDPGTILREDGGIARVIRLNGFSVLLNKEAVDALKEFIEPLLRLTDLDLQFIVESRPLEVDKTLQGYRDLSYSKDLYLSWYMDYLFKYSQRVAEHRYVSRKDFYLVVSRDHGGQEALDNENDSFNQGLNAIFKRLQDHGLKPQLLSRSQLRRLIFNDLKLSLLYGSPEEPIEFDSPSTIADVDVAECCDYLELDGAFLSSLNFSDLPRAACPGWFTRLLMMPFSFTLSVHLSRAEIEGQVEITAFISTFADDKEAVGRQIHTIRERLEEKGAYLEVARESPFKTFTATLPLGVVQTGITHRMIYEDAVGWWPFFNMDCGAESGLPIGFTMGGELVFLNVSPEHNLLVVAGKKDRAFLNSALAMRYIGISEILYFDPDNDFKHFGAILGPDLVKEVDCDQSPSSPEFKKSTVDDGSSFIRLKSEKTTRAALKQVTDCVRELARNMDSSKRVVLMLNNLAPYLKSKPGREELMELINAARQKNIQVVAALDVEDLNASPRAYRTELLVLFGQRFAAPHKTADARQIDDIIFGGAQIHYAIAEANKSGRKKSSLRCVLDTGEGPGLLDVNLSPMDYWFYAQDRASEARRKKMLTDVKTKNSKLSETDAHRQTVYYLGLQHEGD